MPAPAKLPPYVHRILRASEATLHVAELPGDGSPLVLLHGIGMDWRVWQAVSRRLHDHFHLYLMDLRGHGESDKPAHGYSLAHYAADVEDAIDLLGVHDATIVGSSLGGMVAVVVEAPTDIVSHRVLVDPPLTGGPIRDRGMLENILRLKYEPTERLANYLGGYNPRVGRYLLHTMAEMWQSTADGVIAEPLAAPESYFVVDAALRSIDAPVLILQGDPGLGGVLSNQQAQRALTLLPRGMIRRVDGAGHAIHADRPDEFCRLLLAFLGKKRPALAVGNGQSGSASRPENEG
jgi:pimeloyl-ACP methyl ester carboxylesterase